MPLPFAKLCDLFDGLEYPHLREVPYLPDVFQKKVQKTTIEWLRMHCNTINANNTNEEAVKLMLHPEDEKERVYGIEPRDLEHIIARILSLPTNQFTELQKWQHDGVKDDLAARVKLVVDNMKKEKRLVRIEANPVTTDEVDQSLLCIASFNQASSPAVRSLVSKWKPKFAQNGDRVEILSRLYLRLNGREAKWLTRLILKDLSLVKVPKLAGLATNLSGLPNFLPVTIQFTPPISSAIIRDGSRVIVGEGAGLPPNRHMPKTYAALPSSSTPVATGSSRSQPQNTPAEFVATSSTSTGAVITRYQLPPTPPKSSPIMTPPEPKSSQLQGSSKNPLYPSSSSNINSSKSSPRPNHSPPVLAASHPQSSSRAPLGSISSNLPNSQNSQPNSKSPLKFASALIAAGEGICRIAPKICPLTNYIFLLSPCISKNPRILDTLLPYHGSRYTTSMSAFWNLSLPRRCSQTGKRYQRIVLVDTYRTRETVEFLGRVRKRGLKRRNGEREVIEAFDWRLLEAIAKMDQGKQSNRDPWRLYRMVRI